jgi:hypothetical protein
MHMTIRKLHILHIQHTNNDVLIFARAIVLVLQKGKWVRLYLKSITCSITLFSVEPSLTDTKWQVSRRLDSNLRYYRAGATNSSNHISIPCLFKLDRRSNRVVTGRQTYRQVNAQSYIHGRHHGSTAAVNFSIAGGEIARRAAWSDGYKGSGLAHEAKCYTAKSATTPSSLSVPVSS